MTAILRPQTELPLLGSNQDSPDPESDAGPPTAPLDATDQALFGANTARNAPVVHTIPPTTLRRGRTLEYHREWRKTPSGKESLKESQRAFQARHPERVAANRIIGNALRCGRIEKGPCELAGSACKGRIEAHHDDYTKPLEVRWLCKSHHRAADQARRRADVA